MSPQIAIAERERPPVFCPAVAASIAPVRRGEVCYESFTLKGLSAGPLPPIFPGVMTEAFTNISRGAGAAVRALRGNYRPLQFSAHNVLSLTAD
jgi:hypothetical protein